MFREPRVCTCRSSLFSRLWYSLNQTVFDHEKQGYFMRVAGATLADPPLLSNFIKLQELPSCALFPGFT